MKSLLGLILCFISSVAYCQSPLIPYRSNKLWGFADSNGVVKIIPQFDVIESSALTNKESTLFFVQKDKKYGIIINGNVIMPPTYNKLVHSPPFIIELTDDSGSNLYNQKGELLFSGFESLTAPTPHLLKNSHFLFYINTKNSRSGIFSYNKSSQKIEQWIFKNARSIDHIWPDGDVINAAITSINNQSHTYDITFNKPENNYRINRSLHSNQVFGSPTIDQEDYSYSSPLETSNNFFLRTLVFWAKDGKVFSVNIDKRYKDRILKKDTTFYTVDYDTIEDVRYDIYNSRMSHNYHDAAIPYHDTTLLSKIDSGTQYANYLKYKKNGRIGIIAENVVVPAIYDSLSYLPATEKKPFFLVGKYDQAKKKMKYGVIASDYKIILPCIYDEINRKKGLGGFWITKKNNRYGLVNENGQVIFETKFDKVIPDSDMFFYVRIEDKGKFGMANSEVRCEPIFPFKVNRAMYFNGYAVFELVDNEKIIGYADKKGILYFQD